MLQIKNISKQYKTGDLIQHALNDVSLNFRNNEFVSILGPSGSGKTTLLNIVGGLANVLADKVDEMNFDDTIKKGSNYVESDFDKIFVTLKNYVEASNKKYEENNDIS